MNNDDYDVDSDEVQRDVHLDACYGRYNDASNINNNSPNKSFVPTRKTLKVYETQKVLQVLKLLTWNIWCEDDYMYERMAHIVRNIRHQSPDVICLQEVTAVSYSILKKALESQYESFQIFIDEKAAYGLCIMSKKGTTQIIATGDDGPYYYDFEGCTTMGRKVIGCQIVHSSGVKFHILNTHLESMGENDHLRSDQFDIIKKVTKHMKHCFLVGDLNICSPSEEIEKKISESKFYDAWIEMGCPSKIKYTYNYRKNSNVKSRYMSRLDRILYTNKSSFEMKSLSLIGCDTISDTVQIHASDHFGLLAEFNLT